MIYNIENKRIICIGDIHSNFNKLYNIIRTIINKYSISDTIFVVLGDCGFMGDYDDEWLYNIRKKVNRKLISSNNYLYFFRGNHDNPQLFIDDKYIAGKTTRIGVLRDYDILNSDYYGKILIVPGAASIDRYHRIKGYDWWMDEVIVKLSNDEIDTLGEIDIVLSHSLPYYPPLRDDLLINYQMCENNYKCTFETSLRTYLQIETNYLQLLQSKIKAKKWVSGHYHTYREDDLDGTKYIAIDVNEIYELK